MTDDVWEVWRDPMYVEPLIGTIVLTPHRTLGITWWGWEWRPNLPGIYGFTGGLSFSEDRARKRATACMRRYQRRDRKWQAKQAARIVEPGSELQ